jgi:SOS-response transcriptional repressor LexA
MKDAAIADGDMLVVRQQPKAENGEPGIHADSR